MKILVCGLGSVGRRYANILLKSVNHKVYAFRSSKKKGIPGVPDLTTWDQVKQLAPDCAFICTPTDTHIDYALKLSDLGVHWLMEKPIGTSLDNLDELLCSVRDNKVVTYVAYPFRHCPELVRLRSQIVGEEKKATIVCHTDVAKWGKPYSFTSDTGGGVLLELSHEIDLACFLFGDILNINKYSLSLDKNNMDPMQSDVIIRSRHISGVECTFYLSLHSPTEKRYIHFRSSNQNIEIHYTQNDIMYVDQVDYFLGGVESKNMSLMNNLFNASKLFKSIIYLRGSI